MITHTDNVKLIRLLLVEKFAILDEKNSDTDELFPCQLSGFLPRKYSHGFLYKIQICHNTLISRLN